MNKKKILLIENRPGRQEQYFEKAEEKFSQMSNFLNYNSYERVLSYIDNGELCILDEYHLIIMHRSALGELPNGNKLNPVIDYCKKSKKDLILFSGGISTSIYTEEEGNFLLINSKDFYSKNLIPFLEDYHNGNIDKLIQLQYGKSWKLTFLLQLRELSVLKSIGEDYERSIVNLEDVLNLEKGYNIDKEIKNTIELL